jgi:hypothetical protein
MSTISDKISVKKPVIPEQTNVPLDARTVCDSVADFPNIELPYIGMIVFTKSDGKYWKVTELKEKQIGFISVENAQIAKYEEFGTSGGGGTGTVTDFKEGDGIKIENGVISCTVTYGAGEGLKLDGKNFRIDPGKVALKSDIPKQNFDYNALENKPKFIAGDGIKIEVEFAESLIVAGAGNTECNGTYELADHKKKGTARVWQKANRKIYHDGTKWLIDSDADGASFYYSATGTADPWTLTFTAALSEFGNAPTVALVEDSMNDKVQISIKGVQHFDEPQDGFIGLFTDENGLHFTGEALLVTKQELSDYVTKDELSDYVTNKQLGDINSILDEINGEVI